MPTLIGYHEIKDAQHWLSSPRREELFGPLGITNIRTFVDPQNPTRAAVLMDVPDLDAFQAATATSPGAARRRPAHGGADCAGTPPRAGDRLDRRVGRHPAQHGQPGVT